MNRTLRRPMFRTGGSAEGITSGLDVPKLNASRQGYEFGKTVENIKRDMPALRKLYEENMATRGSDFNDFLINLGLDLVSRPRSGNIFQQVATSAAGPYQRFTERKSTARRDQDKLSQALIGDLLDRETTLEEARIEAEGEKGFDPGAGAKIDQLRKQSYRNQLTLENERDAILAVPKENRSEEQNNRLQQIERAELPAVQGTINDLEGGESILSQVKAAGMSERFNDQVDDLMGETNPATNKNYTLQEAFASVLKVYESMFSKKDGGRIGLQMGGQPMPAAMPTDQGPMEASPAQSLTFEELRARLPNTITDDIVTLIASSEQALADFANIQTQQDVNAFNQKYEVNLQLPAEA
jgi:hypothetical protein